MPAVGREDLRQSGEDLRDLGQRVAALSEEVSLLAQSYRNLYERLRVAQVAQEKPPKPEGGAPEHSRGRPQRPKRSWAPTPQPREARSPSEELTSVRASLRALLERQGELGARLQSLSRHPLFAAGGEEPRRIRTRLSEMGERSTNLRLSSDALVRNDPRAVAGLLDDLCELNSGASEDLLRFGQGLRSRGEGILAGRNEDRRYLQGDAWRRPL
ncbi:MAG: hypothetical protein KGJ23_06410 [Euryarchaeota archaeon]|nr:hypothetical protein [Euryarchaeota archaeon]MDE1836233.1 hypothetical protein [Euryarchaeota archaeon]MDE1880886.1 hypothetical protein [Euryarchaeota archaeon]MDE2045006.1 hypothetical protein [Thermoplasmata archaeon]